MGAREIMTSVLELLPKEALLEIALDGLQFGSEVLNIVEDNDRDDFGVGYEVNRLMESKGLVDAL